MNNFCTQQWQDETVVYHMPTGNMHLLPSSHVGILLAINEGVDKVVLIKRIKLDFNLEDLEAKLFLDDLYTEYQKINLIT